MHNYLLTVPPGTVNPFFLKAFLIWFFNLTLPKPLLLNKNQNKTVGYEH